MLNTAPATVLIDQYNLLTKINGNSDIIADGQTLCKN